MKLKLITFLALSLFVIFQSCTIPNPYTSITVVSTVTVPENITINKGDFLVTTPFLSAPIGASFTWTNSNTAIGLAATGSGSIPSFTATNNGITAIIATITVTPTLSGTVGTPSSYTITVNPIAQTPGTPIVTVPANITITKGGVLAATNFVSSPTGANFTWTNSNNAIGLAASGSGNIPSFTATNNGSSAIIATITVTPTVNNVNGTPSSYTITVNPTAPTSGTPTVIVPANIIVDNKVTVTATNFVSTPAGGTFTWTNSNAAIGLAGSGSGNIPSFTATNNGSSAIIATITVTPTVNNVNGTPSSYTITVNPTVTAPAIITLSGSASGLSSHNKGLNCVSCHNPTGPASKFPWKIAGTIYTSAAGTSAAVNLVVKFYTGPNGTGTLKYILNGDKSGNLYTTGPVDFTVGLYPAVVGATSTKYMSSSISTTPTSCNSCHSGGAGTARIWAN